ncbi:MAG: hypothetical protein IKW28_03835 [Lachnospiraceae bacterium]|nr:hypothetical protein [Lachnospiraceae bacterium]
MRSFISLFLMSIISISLLTGCGKDEKLTAFEENMTTFYKNIRIIGNEMDALDPYDEDAVIQMNYKLESMKQQFEILAAMEIPSQFPGIDGLADDALEYMEEAVRLHSLAYEEAEVIDSYIQASSENYESAMKRIEYIATLLQGEIPEGAKITEGDGTEFEPYSE